MKTLYFFAAFLCMIIFNACNGPTKNENTDTLKNATDTVGQISTTDTVVNSDVLQTSGEYIDPDIIRINGVLPVVSSPKLLYATLGKPDSIGTLDTLNTCVTYDKPFKYAYFKGSEFELHSETVVMSGLNFRNSDITLTAGKLTLSGTTTLKELARVFPNAVKAQSVITLNTFEKVTSIRVDTGKIPGDDAWILVFKNGKLIRIDSWMPC